MLLKNQTRVIWLFSDHHVKTSNEMSVCDIIKKKKRLKGIEQFFHVYYVVQGGSNVLNP